MPTRLTARSRGPSALLLPEAGSVRPLFASWVVGAVVVGATQGPSEVCLTLRDKSGWYSDHRKRFWPGWWCS